MADTEKPASELDNGNENPGVSRIKAGQLLREARLRAGLTSSKVAADLRVSASLIEDLEAGDYSKFAGAPYVRALLVSLSRYLRLDPKTVLDAYAAETGSAPAAATVVSPYKDDSKTHAKTHKQIFILLLAVLLFVLLLIMGKVNSSSSGDEEPAPAPGKSDTLLNLDPVGDADSLALDSLDLDSIDIDSLAAKDAAASLTPAKNTATAAIPATPAAAVTTPPAETSATAPSEVSSAKEPTQVRIQALSDSVYIRVIRPGRRESSRTLAPGQSIEVRHDEAITFITRASNSVEVTAGSTVVIPDKRRFKVAGSSITY